MKVTMPHSMDFHSAEVNPASATRDLAPGKSMHYRFVAKHPGVFMYHCATQPVLMHTGMGMVGMFVVKPKHLAPVDKELWITQQEYYLGEPGKGGDMAKMEAKKPDVIAFNGYANQYKDKPITVKKGERVRMYVLNAGPSIWSAFHVIGTVFDRTVVEGRPGADSQTMNLAPSRADGPSSRSRKRAATRSSPTRSPTPARAPSASCRPSTLRRRPRATTWAARPRTPASLLHQPPT